MATGYDKNKEGFFYIYKRGKYLKFGITNKRPKHRMKFATRKVNHRKEDVEMIFLMSDVNGEVIQNIERHIKAQAAIKKHFVVGQATIDGEKFDGHTETVSYSEYNLNLMVDIALDYY